MIYTVTLNPSIDYVVRLDKLTSGITNRTTSEEYYFGGKGINVSCVLAELGLDSTAYGFVAGFTGEAIEKGIRNDRIITDFVCVALGVTLYYFSGQPIKSVLAVVNIGTIITAFFMGPLIDIFTKNFTKRFFLKG